MQKIKLSIENKKQIISEIKRYFSQERDEDIGDLSADLLLDFILENIGPTIYNQAIDDAHTFMNLKVEDLYELEIK